MPTSSSIVETTPLAQKVRVTADELTVQLVDGRRISVPLAWFPRLLHATPRQRGKWKLLGGGEGIHWPLVDEDLSVEGLLAGRPSGESQASLKKWLATRPARKTRGSRRRRRSVQAS